MKVGLGDVIRTAPPSVDQRARLFQMHGRIYRAFRGEPAVLYRRLLGEDWLPDLFEAGLIPFRATDVELEGYEFVVESDRIPVVSYPPEWPTRMVKEAGQRIATLGSALARHGLGYQDGHPWNILFDGPTSVFIDLGSIMETDEVTRGWMWEFRRHIVLPLTLHQMGLHQLGESVQHTQRGGWTGRLDRRGARLFPPQYTSLVRHRRDPAVFFDALGRYVHSLAGRAAKTDWSDYELDVAQVGVVKQYNDKQRSVDAMLAGLQPGTLLDVGANEGWYSRLAASRGQSVIAIDVDDRSLGRLYELASRQHLPILPLRIDLMWPPGSSGLGLEYKPSTERIRSDTVMMLAVLHHLIGWQGMTFDAVARVLDLFAIKHVIVEFIPSGDMHVSKWPLATDPTYTRAGFESAMAPFFRLVESKPSTPAPREILLFDRV